MGAGQGQFRDDVITTHKKCPFTGVSNTFFLIASHIKPWAKCNNEERLDPYNGIPLTPVADKLVDLGLVTFDDSGKAIFSKDISKDDLSSMGILVDKDYYLPIIDKKQIKYIKYHREHRFQQK